MTIKPSNIYNNQHVVIKKYSDKVIFFPDNFTFDFCSTSVFSK